MIVRLYGHPLVQDSLTHVQLDDVPRTPIQPSVEGEFRQHDGVVTVMMTLPTQGFA